MTEQNEYAVSEDDLKGGGGGDRAKPRGSYTGQISRAKAEPDKNKKLCLKFGIAISHGTYKKQLLFENYLSLDPNGNKFNVARRNSFYKAIGLNAGDMPYGTTANRPASALNGTYVDVTVEHEYEQVPGEKYSITTSKSPKSRWVIEGWEAGLDSNGNLVKSPGGTAYDAPIKPRESLTFYALSDEFEGVGDPEAATEEPAADESADDDWGV